MAKNKILLWSLADAFGVLVYIVLVALFMNSAEKVFPRMNEILGPIVILLLFVLSAAVTGSLVLGRPVLAYLDGSKKEATIMFLYTLGWLLLFLILFLTVNCAFHA